MPVKTEAADLAAYCIMLAYEMAHFGLCPGPHCIVGAVCFSQHALPSPLLHLLLPDTLTGAVGTTADLFFSHSLRKKT